MWEAPLWQAQTSSGRVSLAEKVPWSFLREFALTELPELLEPMFDDLVTIESLMKAQWLTATEVASQMGNVKYRKTAQSLSQHKNAKSFIKVLGISVEGYCRQANGLTDKQFKRMEDGDLSIWELLRENPVVFLAPLLPVNKLEIN